MGTLWCNCAKLHETIKMSFGMVSEVGRGMGVLDGIHIPQGEGDGFDVGLLIWDLPLYHQQKCIWFM